MMFKLERHGFPDDAPFLHKNEQNAFAHSVDYL